MMFSVVALAAIMSLAQASPTVLKSVQANMEKGQADMHQLLMNSVLPSAWKNAKVHEAAVMEQEDAEPTLFQSAMSLVSGEKKTKGYITLYYYSSDDCSGTPVVEQGIAVAKCFNVDVEGGEYSFYVKSTSDNGNWKQKTNYYMGYECEGEKFETDKDEWPASCSQHSGEYQSGTFHSVQAGHVTDKKVLDTNIMATGETMLLFGHNQAKKNCKKAKYADYVVMSYGCEMMGDGTSINYQCVDTDNLEIAFFTDSACQVANTAQSNMLVGEAGCSKQGGDDDDDGDDDEDDDDFNAYDHMKWEYARCIHTASNLRK